MQITISGPISSGKGSLARGLARTLGFVHIDVGMIFRAMAFALSSELIAELKEFSFSKCTNQWEYAWNGCRAEILYYGEPVSTELTNPEIALYTARLVEDAENLKTMTFVVERLAYEHENIVADGLNAGTVLFRDADHKFYTHASLHVRAERRYHELKSSRAGLTISKIEKDLLQQDRRDLERAFAPLRIPEGAHLIDTTTLTKTEMLNEALAIMSRNS
jgi:cytidylate kinase